MHLAAHCSVFCILYAQSDQTFVDKNPDSCYGQSKVSINPFMPNGISHCYQLEQSISVLRNVGWKLSLILTFYSH